MIEETEFNEATSSLFNIDTRLTIEKQAKSEDDWRRSQLESTLREAKYRKTSEGQIEGPTIANYSVENCLLVWTINIQRM